MRACACLRPCARREHTYNQCTSVTIVVCVIYVDSTFVDYDLLVKSENDLDVVTFCVSILDGGQMFGRFVNGSTALVRAKPKVSESVDRSG